MCEIITPNHAKLMMVSNCDFFSIRVVPIQGMDLTWWFFLSVLKKTRHEDVKLC